MYAHCKRERTNEVSRLTKVLGPMSVALGTLTVVCGPRAANIGPRTFQLLGFYLNLTTADAHKSAADKMHIVLAPPHNLHVKTKS